MNKTCLKKHFMTVGILSVLMTTACGQTDLTSLSNNDLNNDLATNSEEESNTSLENELNNETDNKTITIVYTNDVHSYIDNYVASSASDNDIPEDTEIGLRYSSVSQLVKYLRANGENVFFVDAGDEISGSSYGSMDNGESIIELMNESEYQLATIGNHEFDYGVDQLMKVVKEADFPYISCNFHCLDESLDSEPFEAYKMIEIAGKTIAFIGVTTPTVITSSTPTYFQNEDGEFIYYLDGQDDPQDLYDTVQECLDEVKDEADYVIGLGHLGVGINEQNRGISSYDLIANTSGFDAFIDGHSHTLMEGEWIEDKEDNKVLLTQTGAYLETAGIMTIDENGNFSTKLINEYDTKDDNVAAIEDELIAEKEALLGQQIAVLDFELYDSNPDDSSIRLIRAEEMNAGDFTADAFYWYFNEEKKMDCDIAFSNGGGIRDNLSQGVITLGDIKNIFPFGNELCLISATGQQILDCLEVGASVTGNWDEETNMPAENGSFMQVAGMKYTVDTSINTSVKKDEEGMFEKVDGSYRVKNVEIYNKETKEYEALQLDKQYKVAGTNFILSNCGGGLSMFKNSEMIQDYAGQDYVVLAAYCESFKKSSDYPEISTENSVLCSYDNYLIDYENPYGSSRIIIE